MAALATITIDVLSRESGIDVDTIRAFERMGLLPKPRRVANNLLLYSTDDVGVAMFAQKALALGFSPQAVRELLRLANARASNCADIHALAQRHLKGIRRRIAELRSMEKALAPLVACCSPDLPIRDCPILQALAEPSNRE